MKLMKTLALALSLMASTAMAGTTVINIDAERPQYDLIANAGSCEDGNTGTFGEGYVVAKAPNGGNYHIGTDFDWHVGLPNKHAPQQYCGAIYITSINRKDIPDGTYVVLIGVVMEMEQVIYEKYIFIVK